jgi:hypothetical protein
MCLADRITEGATGELPEPTYADHENLDTSATGSGQVPELVRPGWGVQDCDIRLVLLCKSKCGVPVCAFSNDLMTGVSD